MRISSQLESALSFRVSTAWFASCGDGLRHFGKEFKNQSIRPCPWSMSVTRRAANGTCVAPSILVWRKVCSLKSRASFLWRLCRKLLLQKIADRELEHLL